MSYLPKKSSRKKQTQFQPLSSEIPISIPIYRLSEKIYWFNVVNGAEVSFEEIYKSLLLYAQIRDETK